MYGAPIATILMVVENGWQPAHATMSHQPQGTPTMSDYQPVERAIRSPEGRRASFGGRGIATPDREYEPRGRGLDIQERMLIEQRVTNDAKSTGTAYLLWLFLGGLGGHRFYLGRSGTGFVMFGLWLLGLLTIFVGIGGIFLAIVVVWALIDAFRIPGMIKADKEALRLGLSTEALIMR